MAAFVFGTPMQMMAPQKPTLRLFGGTYLFSIEGTTQTGAFCFWIRQRSCRIQKQKFFQKP